ncbi:hypothetical protein VB711_26110 [Cronbergia sp. UHCC 0137]|uniref:PFE-CTERM domain-containing protein n=1 Tax=Cronbergia sp. UHCC 0137 TaxID=3110239 RepID=UPI002B20CE02|nr:hypothetical protein [Cronbergia sp. UHCC 0137]MEA5621283.1 hypothetical protein [Cronbergia sp. UHCC 0137]
MPTSLTLISPNQPRNIMTKLAKICSALVISFTTYIAGASSAEAISLNLSWNANGLLNSADNYSLTGTFTGADTVSDGFIRSSDSEITDFTLNFFKNGTPLASYDFATISVGQYNFNYEIATNTILQDGALNTPTGFSIGDSTAGYWLDSQVGSGLSFNDSNGFESASGGTLTATPVPFEPNASTGILTLGMIWGANQWRKNRLKK